MKGCCCSDFLAFTEIFQDFGCRSLKCCKKTYDASFLMSKDGGILSGMLRAAWLLLIKRGCFKWKSRLDSLAVVQLPGTEERKRERLVVWAESPARLRKCPVEGGGVRVWQADPSSPTSPPSPFSPSPQSISNAFLQSSNKRGNWISSTVRPCEISFASRGLCAGRAVKTRLHHALFTV